MGTEKEKKEKQVDGLACTGRRIFSACPLRDPGGLCKSTTGVAGLAPGRVEGTARYGATRFFMDRQHHI